MARLTRPHTEAKIESFRKNPVLAAEYLNAVLADGDEEEVLIAVRDIAEAFGGMSNLTEKAEVNATTLFRTLSPRGNPELRSLTAILTAMGMRLAVEPIPQH